MSNYSVSKTLLSTKYFKNVKKPSSFKDDFMTFPRTTGQEVTGKNT